MAAGDAATGDAITGDATAEGFPELLQALAAEISGFELAGETNPAQAAQPHSHSLSKSKGEHEAKQRHRSHESPSGANGVLATVADNSQTKAEVPRPLTADFFAGLLAPLSATPRTLESESASTTTFLPQLAIPHEKGAPSVPVAAEVQAALPPVSAAESSAFLPTAQMMAPPTPVLEAPQPAPKSPQTDAPAFQPIPTASSESNDFSLAQAEPESEAAKPGHTAPRLTGMAGAMASDIPFSTVPVAAETLEPPQNRLSAVDGSTQVQITLTPAPAPVMQRAMPPDSGQRALAGRKASTELHPLVPSRGVDSLPQPRAEIEGTVAEVSDDSTAEPRRTGGQSSPEPVSPEPELAFRVHLARAERPEAPAHATAAPPANDESPDVKSAAPAAPTAAEHPREGRAENHAKKQDSLTAGQPDSGAPAASLDSRAIQAVGSTEAAPSLRSQSQHAAQLAPAAAAPRTPPTSVSEIKPQVAHDIQLHLDSNDTRVNVRLVERGGEVRVDVSTPDNRMSGVLRDDLSSLTARLEQNGFHAETWHPASAAAAERERAAEPSASVEAQPQQQQGQQDRGEPQQQQQQRQQHPRQSARYPQSQQQPKDFSWLLSSLK
jgi:hypothetical protein